MMTNGPSGDLDDEELVKRAANIRRLIIRAIDAAGSGHAGGSLSCAEIMTCLFFRSLVKLPEPRGWPFRNRFVLSKGHADAAYYSTLCEAGLIDSEEHLTMRKTGSRLQGHPDPTWLPDLVEFAGGPLGQGLSFGLGLADALDVDRRVFVMLGDGELQEGQVWEAVLAGGRSKTSNIVAIIDWNQFQLSGPTPANPDISGMARAWGELGWDTAVCNGHDIAALSNELEKRTDRPRAVFARTVKGRGVSFMEANNDFHGRTLDAAEVRSALEELNA